MLHIHNHLGWIYVLLVLLSRWTVDLNAVPYYISLSKSSVSRNVSVVEGYWKRVRNWHCENDDVRRKEWLYHYIVGDTTQILILIYITYNAYFPLPLKTFFCMKHWRLYMYQMLAYLCRHCKKLLGHCLRCACKAWINESMCTCIFKVWGTISVHRSW